jgi:multicomponent Na+:H+ antiporter subunit D
MCYAEHHLKRMLAFSTICHAGIMLTALGLGGPLAFAAMMVYLAAHAFIKGGLFLGAGIVLHRLRAIGERSLFGKGKTMRWTALLWFSGALGLASAPPYLSMLAEGGISKAAEDVGMHFVPWFCLIGGAITSAAILRVGMHTFFGWGTKPITDEAAEVGELPETASEDQRISWSQYFPAAVCITVPVLFLFESKWLPALRDAGATFASRAEMLDLTYNGSVMYTKLAPWPLALAAFHGSLAFALAVLLAGTSVFRTRLPRPLRIGAFVESGIPLLRAMQSGHPGDYVFWITVGLAIFGSAALILLR